MEFHLLIISTGSVASIKIPTLIKKLALKYDKLLMQLVVTQNSEFFFKNHSEELSSIVTINRDADEWKGWNKVGDDILHIELTLDISINTDQSGKLTKWADLMLIAPLDANTLAKLANGICDNLVCSVCRAWDFSKPILFAPAMNTKMWNHPITSKHTETLQSWGYMMIPPISKTLACGDTGVGAMENVDQLIQILDSYITNEQHHSKKLKLK